jgi:hypothetical protein
VDPTEKEVVVRTDAGADRALDAAYVAEHLEHAYALTAHTIQGGTVEWAGVVGHPHDFTRNWSYTALSRAREATELFLIDSPTEHQLARAEVAPEQSTELGDPRTPLERLDAAMRQRDDEDLALDRIDQSAAPTAVERDLADTSLAGAVSVGRPVVDELLRQLAELRDQIGHYPEHLADQLHAARSARVQAQRAADDARARLVDLEPRHGGLFRRRAGEDPAVALERERLKLAEQQLAAATARESALAPRVPERNTWEAERRVLLERAAALEGDLSMHRRVYLSEALEHPAPYLAAALGPLPDQPRARRTWQHAAQRIEAYRFDHQVTNMDDALGPAPGEPRARGQWQQVRQDIQRAQHELGHPPRRGLGHEV